MIGLSSGCDTWTWTILLSVPRWDLCPLYIVHWYDIRTDIRSGSPLGPVYSPHLATMQAKMSCLLDCKCNSSWCRMRRWFITTLHVHPFLQLGKSRFKSWICSSTCAERACLNNRNSLHILVFWGPQAQKLRKGELGKQTSKFEVGCGHAFSQPSIKSERGRTGHSCFFSSRLDFVCWKSLAGNWPSQILIE